MSPGPGSLAAAHASAGRRAHLSQFGVLVFQDDLVFLQFLQFGLGGHLLQLQLLAGALLLLQLLLQFLPQRRGDCEQRRPHKPSGLAEPWPKPCLCGYMFKTAVWRQEPWSNHVVTRSEALPVSDDWAESRADLPQTSGAGLRWEIKSALMLDWAVRAEMRRTGEK